jgi:hypothetical protein
MRANIRDTTEELVAACARLTGGMDDPGPSSVNVRWVTHKNANVDRGAWP